MKPTRRTTKKRKGLIIFAIPTYNEADNIRNITTVIDKGLQKYFRSYDTLIINADNDSPDNTKEAFLRTATKSRKKYLSSKKHYERKVKGKGYNMQMALEYAQKTNAIAIGFVDGDVKSASPLWVKKLISPIIKGHDQVLPIFLRNEYDGSITNILVFPVMYGFLNANIRQPIGGETALSRNAINVMLLQKWNDTAYLYGVDIYFVIQGIINRLRMTQVFLGIKEHKPSGPKLDAMFLQVANSLLGQLRYYKKAWDMPRIQQKRIPVIADQAQKLHTPEVGFDYKHRKEMLIEDFRKHKRYLSSVCNKALINYLSHHLLPNETFRVPARDWAEIVYTMLHRKKNFSEKDLAGLRVLFFARFLTYYREVLDMAHESSEKHITQQAKTFRVVRRQQKSRQTIL
ncbi:MAG: glycosyltransferase [bacterium]|nr:glycosyltransferase [bacterium]